MPPPAAQPVRLSKVTLTKTAPSVSLAKQGGTSGAMRVKWGDHLERELMLEPRDLVYVPPRETHVLENASETDPAEYVVARDSPHEDAVVVPWAQEAL